ncbi:protein 60A-like [Musca domestica]|uniref:Protein 60A-like n=2 Tax=Musca domestica TaxID=7370 RepID=A0ABM3VBS4_MUSDO|nr:protein 60A-like [Musca domestica]
MLYYNKLANFINSFWPLRRKYTAIVSSSKPPICLSTLLVAFAMTVLLDCIAMNPSETSSSSIMVSATQSGIYVDNGRGQTEIHHVLDEDERMAAAYDILEFLGLPERPKRKHGHLSLRKSAPQFLLDVYHRLKEEENDDEPPASVRSKRDLQEQENFITDLDKRAIEESDIIMTFLNKNHHVEEVRHEHGRRLWFDVSDVAEDNYLMMAELRIYQNPAQGKWATSGREFTINVYSIVKTNGHDVQLQILSSVNTTADYQGWLELNVTEGLSSWLHQPKENKGLYVGAHPTNKPEREIKLDDIGLVHPKGDDEHQPFMVGFFRGPELIKQVKHHSRRKRDTHTRRRKKSDIGNPLMDGPGEGSRSCQMQTLYIAFKDLGWRDWIIAPDGYGAYYCSGECNFPLNAHMNATNHAIVQTLVHLLERSKVPKPCCAPTRLGALPVLYHLDEQHVNLKKYKNMIVKSCGCH